MLASTELASYIASRVFHDVSSPLTSLMFGSSSAFEDGMGAEMKARGEQLVMESIEELKAKVEFFRFALGSQGLSAGAADVAGIRSTLSVMLARQKSSLDWRIHADAIENRQMRVLMNMAVVLFDPVTKGGVLRVSCQAAGEPVRLVAEAVGGAAALKAETVDALEGRVPENGWSGKNVQPYFARLIAEETGLVLEGDIGPDGPRLVARPR